MAGFHLRGPDILNQEWAQGHRGLKDVSVTRVTSLDLQKVLRLETGLLGE